MNDLRHDPDVDVTDGPAPAVIDPAYFDGPPVINPVAERTAFLRQWQPIPDGVPCWGRTVMHTPDGNTYTNVDPPAKPSPVAAFDALRDQFGAHFDNVDPEAMVNPPEPPAKWQGSTRDDTPPAPEAPDLRTVGERVAECEQAIAALWDETGSESWNMRQLLGRVETLERTQAEIMARLAAVEGYGEKANYAAQMAARHEDRLAHLERVTHRLLNPGEQEGGE